MQNFVSRLRRMRLHRTLQFLQTFLIHFKFLVHVVNEDNRRKNRIHQHSLKIPNIHNLFTSNKIFLRREKYKKNSTHIIYRNSQEHRCRELMPFKITQSLSTFALIKLFRMREASFTGEISAPMFRNVISFQHVLFFGYYTIFSSGLVKFYDSRIYFISN